MVLGASGGVSATAADTDEEVAEYVPRTKVAEAPSAPVADTPASDEDDDLDFFRKLAG